MTFFHISLFFVVEFNRSIENNLYIKYNLIMEEYVQKLAEKLHKVLKNIDPKIQPLGWKIFVLLMIYGKLTANDIMNYLNCSRSKTYQNLSELEKSGYVYKTPDGYYMAHDSTSVLIMAEEKTYQKARKDLINLRKILGEIDKLAQNAESPIKRLKPELTKPRIRNKKVVRCVVKGEKVKKFVSEMITNIFEYNIEKLKIYKPYDVSINIPEDLKEKIEVKTIKKRDIKPYIIADDELYLYDENSDDIYHIEDKHLVNALIDYLDRPA